MRKIKYIQKDELRELLKYIKEYKNIVFVENIEDIENPVGNRAFIADGKVTINIVTRCANKTIGYEFRKDCVENIKPITGADAFRVLSQYCKIEKVEVKKDLSARPFMYYNKKYNGQRHKAYGYDLNSAYSFAMLGDMPDTTQKVGEFRIVKEGELGFKEGLKVKSDGTEYPDLKMVEPGKYADIIFKSMPSPFTKFVQTWYKRKANASNKIEKAKAKGMLNFSIGFLQKRNPYLRAAIITRCNNLMMDLVDKNTLYCNTDSLVSLERRLDIEKNLGTNIGQWKIEHTGDFAYIGYNYQWNLEKPSYRGVPNSWFKDDYDILKDGVPKFGNVYELNHDTLELMEVIYEEEG